MGAKLQVPEANRYEPVLPSMQRPTNRAYVAIGLAAAHSLSLHAEGLVAAAVVFATNWQRSGPSKPSKLLLSLHKGLTGLLISTG
jgi:hypothetical protein